MRLVVGGYSSECPPALLLPSNLSHKINKQKLCEKLGMRKEGEFKEFVSFIKDENGAPIYENTWQYAILKKEWEQGPGN